MKIRTSSYSLKKLKYQKINSDKYGGSSGDQEGEIGLFAGGFKGKCNNCGKQGHKAKDCRAPGGGAYSGRNNGNKNVNANVECLNYYYWCLS